MKTRTITLDDETDDAVVAEALRLDRPISWVVRKLVRDALLPNLPHPTGQFPIIKDTTPTHGAHP